MVPNWSFEEYNFCPTSGTQDCENTFPNIPSLQNWFCALSYKSTPDYFNACGIPSLSTPTNIVGVQIPKTGIAYLGMYTHNLNNNGYNNSEYIECQLNDSLKANTHYCVTYFVSRADKRDYASSNFGALFTNTVINIPGLPHYINQVPQVQHPFGTFITDKINWTKIEGAFMANGGEYYLTLLSFGANSNFDTLYAPSSPIDPLGKYEIPYYYLDDVSVEEVLNAQAGTDKTINCGDTTAIGADSAIGASYKWFPSAGLNYDTLAFPMATPSITTKYVVQKTQCKIITYDTVIVNVTNTCPYINYQDEFIIPNVFTPNGDNVNDVWSFNLGFGNTLKGLYVYNRWGNIVNVTSSIDNVSFIKWDGRTTSGIECSSGVYFYVLEYTNILGEQKKVNGYISLIR